MPFGVVSGVGRGMRVLDEVVMNQGEGAALRVNLGMPMRISIGSLHVSARCGLLLRMSSISWSMCLSVYWPQESR